MKTLHYLIITCLILLGFNCSAQIDTCDAQIHAVSDTPCSSRILHLGVEADTLPNTTYTWEGPGGWVASGDSVMRDTVSITSTGNYIVTGIRGICTYKDTVNVYIRPKPFTPVIIALNSPLCVGDTLRVFAPAGGFEWLQYFYGPDSLLLFTSDATLEIQNIQKSMEGLYYTFNVSTDQICSSDTTYFNVQVDSCTLNVADINIDHPFIPTLLQSSDPVFKPIFKSGNSADKMQVFDINGKKVFEANNGEGWDRSAYQGLYYYIITRQTSVYKGRLMLL